jgi:hypothetical protein
MNAMRSAQGPLVRSLASQWNATLRLLRRSVACFDAGQWKSGISQFEVPWKVAYHTLQCLAYYFRDDPEAAYRQIPMRFDGDWWQLEESEAPTQEEVLDYHDDIEARVDLYLTSLSDDDLASPFPGFGTVLANLAYAMRHTMHHQGGLNLLAVHHRIDVDLWDAEE